MTNWTVTEMNGQTLYEHNVLRVGPTRRRGGEYEQVVGFAAEIEGGCLRIQGVQPATPMPYLVEQVIYAAGTWEEVVSTPFSELVS